MRTTNFYATILCCLFMPFLFNAQEEASAKHFWIHEDVVKPSMLQEYEKSAMELAQKCKEYNIEDVNWITSSTDDFRYLYVTPINSMADINSKGFDKLREKMGAEAFGNMFSSMDKCYTKHGSYVITLDPELTYMPDGITQTPDGQNYRKFYYLYTTPENFATLGEKMAEVKKLYADNGSKSHYRVYRSGFGTMSDYYLVAVAAEDAIDFEQRSAENDALLGEEAGPVFADVMKYVTKMDVISGRMRPDLAYSPSINN